MKPKISWFKVVAILMALSILLTACGTEPAATTPATSAPTNTVTTNNKEEPTKAPIADAPTSTALPVTPTEVPPTPVPAASELAVGSTGETNGLKITLNGVRHETTGTMAPKSGMEYLIVDLTFENTSKDEKAVSSLLSFSVKDESAQKYTVSIGAQTKSSADGKVAVGDKLRGESAFEVPKDAKGLVFIYDPVLGGDTLRFKLDKTVASTSNEVPPTSAPITSQLAIGSTGETNGLKIMLNGVRHETSGLVDPKSGMEYLIVDLTFENTGTAEKAVSSLLSFSVKDDTGQKYSIGFGAQTKSSADGKVAAGDKLRGESAFEVPLNAKGLVFVYDPILGGNTLTFKLDK